MNAIRSTLIWSAIILAAPVAIAEGEKDCLLQGTVQHVERGGQETTMVKIDEISKYDESSRCKVRQGQKLEFKLPADSRVQEAPSGSAVKYRYRTDNSGGSNSELISIGT